MSRNKKWTSVVDADNFRAVITLLLASDAASGVTKIIKYIITSVMAKIWIKKKFLSSNKNFWTVRPTISYMIWVKVDVSEIGFYLIWETINSFSKNKSCFIIFRSL